jgi:polysaccharide export outer membrane protein
MFQGMNNIDALNKIDNRILHSNFEIELQKNDIILIGLITSNQEFLKLFEMGTEANALTPNSYGSGMPNLSGFRIDNNGKIEVPFIGAINAENRKISDLNIEITEKLKEYITDPIVNIKLLNFKVTVLGEVRDPGTFNIPNEKISIFQILGVAKGLNPTADLQKAKLIREWKGKVIEYPLDLSKSDILFSEKYFLRQNDILYIPPNKVKQLNSNYSPIYISVISSVLSTLITTISFIIK